MARTKIYGERAPVMLRLPVAVHRKLIAMADRDMRSPNSLAVVFISQAVANEPDPAPPAVSAAPAKKPKSKKVK